MFVVVIDGCSGCIERPTPYCVLFFYFIQTINKSVENVARFHLDAYFMSPLTRYNAVMEFVLTKANDNITEIATNFVFPTKIKSAAGIKDPKLKVSFRVYNLRCRMVAISMV